MGCQHHTAGRGLISYAMAVKIMLIFNIKKYKEQLFSTVGKILLCVPIFHSGVSGVESGCFVLQLPEVTNPGRLQLMAPATDLRVPN